MRRLAIVTSHPIQYQAPWFRALTRVVDLEVFFCHRQDAAGQAAAGFGVPFEWDVPVLDGYSHTWLTNVSSAPDVSSFAGCDTPEVGRRLAEGRFDGCIVNGWYLKSYLQAIEACRHAGLRLLVRGDSHLRTPRSWLRSALKQLPYRWFLGRIDAHLYVGKANRDYLKSYGVRDERLFFVPHFVDNSFFSEHASSARQSGMAAAVREQLGLRPETTVFLFVGKFIAEKGPADFVRACAALAAEGAPVAGVFVGEGPLAPELRELARGLDAPVRFAGFRNQRELPAFYAMADALVLPSVSETWGLVVNEAMACGLPALVSREAGCADDLLEEGRTGYTFPAGDVAALTIRMRQMTSADRQAMSCGARTRVGEYTVEKAVEGTLRALAA